MQPTLAIIGFGAFGRFMARHLRERYTVVVCDAVDMSAAAAEVGVRVVDLAGAARAGVIVLAVPVQRLETMLAELARLIPTDARPLVVDVASVKVRPVEMMMRLLPTHVEIVGTHPLFGPQSGRNGIAGLPIALCPVRVGPGRLEEVRAFLSASLGLRVIEVSPDEHDRAMAYVQGLTHLVSRALGEIPLPETALATIAYERLLAMRANLAQDSWELFLTIERENPYAEGVRRKFADAIGEIERRLGLPG